MQRVKLEEWSFNQNNPAFLSLQNLLIQNSIFYSATKIPSVSHIIFLGSSCMYPRDNDGPMNEDLLFEGKLEPTSFAYSMAKLSGVSVAESINQQSCGCTVTTIIPSGVYGPGDDFNLKSAHVIAALIKKFSTSKKKNKPSVTLFGDGSPVRQFVFVNDVADFVVYCLDNKNAAKEFLTLETRKVFQLRNWRN